MIHVHVASGTPVGCRYMTQSGTYEHQGTLSIGKSTDCFCTAFNLTVETLNSVIGVRGKVILQPQDKEFFT